MILKRTYYTIDSLKENKPIKCNIERWRWESIQSESKHILINIPSTFKFYSNDSMLLYSKVITGKPETPTPSILILKLVTFSFIRIGMSHTIATKEILPKLKKIQLTLHLKTLKYLTAETILLTLPPLTGNDIEKYFPFRLRQRDGTENTLGVLKFMFSNPYAIYLHDNPRTLFSKENRWLSHGCIRLDKAKNLLN